MKPIILALIAMAGVSTLSGCMVVTCADGTEAKDAQGKVLRVTTEDEKNRAVATYCLSGDPAAADLSAVDPAVVEAARKEAAALPAAGPSNLVIPAGGGLAALLLALAGGSTDSANSTTSTQN